MSTIDDRVVAMKFDNSNFEDNVKTTMSTLDKLKAALKFDGSKKGLEDLSQATKNVPLEDMASGVDKISGRFSAMGAIAFTVIQNLTNNVLAFSNRVLSGILDPIFQGGKDRALKIEQAKFQFRGLGQDVEKSMESALDAVRGTAYGLDAAASVAAQFGATGMKAGAEMTGALRGVAGMAAMTGRSYEEIGSIFTTIAGEGKLSTMRMQQFATRGVNVAAKLADQMNITEAQVRKLVSQGKISFKEFAGYMDDAFGEHATKANETYTGSVANMRAALSRIGASIQVPRLEAMRKIFNALTPVIDSFHEALGPAISQFTKFTELASGNLVKRLEKVNFTWLKFAMPPALEGVKNILRLIQQVLGTLAGAFRDVFPPKSSIDIMRIAQSFKAFTDNLKLSDTTINNLRRTFRGFFALISIGWTIFKGFLGLLGNLLGVAGKASGGILGFTGNIGDMLVKLDEALKKGEFLNIVFGAIGSVLTVPIKLVGLLGQAFQNMSASIDGSIINKIVNGFKQVGEAIGSFLTSGSMDTASSLLGSGALAGIYLLLRKFIGGINDLFGEGIFGATGILGGVKEVFGTLTGSLQAMQTQIQAKSLLLIASALAVLAVSVVALSMVDSKNLAKALSALTVAFTQLLGAMAILVKISGSAGFVKVPLIAASMVLLSGSILLLVGAIALMGQLSWAEIGKGLAGIAGALTVIAGAMRLMPKGMVAQSVALFALGAALDLIAVALYGMSRLSWEEIGKGLAAIAGALLVVAIAMRAMPKGILLQAGALVAVGAALNLFALALAGMGSMGWEQIGKGLVALGGGLLILAVGLNAMSGGAILGAVALTVAAKGLLALAGALVIMGAMSWKMIAKGLTVMAAAFIVIGLAGLVLAPIIPAILGLGLAMLALGAALALAGAGVLAFSIAFASLATVGAAGIGVLLELLKGVIELIPFTLENLAKGFVAFTLTLAENAPAFINAFVEMISAALDGVIRIAPKFGETLLVMLQTGLRVLREGAPDMINTGIALILAFLDGVERNIYQITTKAIDIVLKFIAAVGDKADDIVQAGVDLVIDFLNGIAKAIGSKDNQKRMLDAGVAIGKAIGQGMLNGLTSMGGSVARKAASIASSAIAGPLKILGIGGPSKEFEKIGRWVAIGLGNGMEDNANIPAKSAMNMAKGSVEPIRTAITKLMDGIDADPNLQPTITPVLDLTNVKKGSSQIGNMFDSANLATGTYSTAAGIAALQDSTTNVDGIKDKDSKSSVTYVQNNNSPKALSEIEIYRNTKNLLSMGTEDVEK